MSNKILLDSEDNFVTDIGAAFVGQRAVLRGKDLHHDLKYCTWMETFIYGITGRFYTKEEIKLLNCIWAYTGYPDPRLWNNRVAALAGTTRSTRTAGVSAAIFLSEATVYGTRVCVRCIDLLQRAKKAIEQGDSLRSFVKQEIKRYHVLFGYGRPINSGVDERIPPTLKLMEELDIEVGPYVELAFAIEKILPGQRMNMVALASAIAADLDFTTTEYYSFIMFCFSGGMFPCVDETLSKPEGSFFPLRSESVDYQGVSRRKWQSNGI